MPGAINLHGSPTIDDDGINIDSDGKCADFTISETGGEYTISIWANFHDIERNFNDLNNKFLINSGLDDIIIQGVNNGWGVYYDKYIRVQGNNGSIYNFQEVETSRYAHLWNYDEWTNIVFKVYSSESDTHPSSAKSAIYINGIKKGEEINYSTRAKHSPYSSRTFYIGSTADKLKTIRGHIKSVNLWNRALSDNDISALYAEGWNKKIYNKWIPRLAWPSSGDLNYDGLTGKLNDAGDTFEITQHNPAKYHYSTLNQGNISRPHTGGHKSINQNKSLIITANPIYAPKVGNYYWTQIGYDINGENNYDRFGHDAKLSKNGKFLVAGALYGGYSSGYSYKSGSVRVFEWKQYTADMAGEYNHTDTKQEPPWSLNRNEYRDTNLWKRLIITGSPSTPPQLEKYYWTQIGYDINGTDRQANFGECVAMSGEDDINDVIIVIGCPYSNIRKMPGNNYGSVYICSLNNEFWSPTLASLDSRETLPTSYVQPSLSERQKRRFPEWRAPPIF